MELEAISSQWRQLIYRRWGNSRQLYRYLPSV